MALANGNSTTSASASKKRGYSDPEYVVINELLSTMGDVDGELQGNGLGGPLPKRLRATATAAATAGEGGRGATAGKRRSRPFKLDVDDLESGFGNGLNGGNGDNDDDDDDDDDDEDDDDDDGRQTSSAASRHTKLTDLEQHVRDLERENLHLKQTLLLGKKGSVMIAGGRGSHEHIQHMLRDRTRVVQEMVDQLNAPVLSLSDAARVWHEDCRIGVGVKEWDAFGRLETISLWNMIRCVFASIAVDIVELRPHLPDGEMILTKWRVQGEIASPAQLQSVISSEDCPPTMRVMLQGIKSSDLTFTVTTYVIFDDSQIAEQHHCWDQVGVFKRLFGGEIPKIVQEMLTIPEEDEDEDEDEEDHDQEEDGDEDADDGEDEDEEQLQGGADDDGDETE